MSILQRGSCCNFSIMGLFRKQTEVIRELAQTATVVFVPNSLQVFKSSPARSLWTLASSAAVYPNQQHSVHVIMLHRIQRRLEERHNPWLSRSVYVLPPTFVSTLLSVPVSLSNTTQLFPSQTAQTVLAARSPPCTTF